MSNPRVDHLPDDWTLTFRATGQGPPVEIRVRRLLKAALRTYGLRCVRHAGTAANKPPADETTTDPPPRGQAARLTGG